jgi:hypothetical protein
MPVSSAATGWCHKKWEMMKGWWVKWDGGFPEDLLMRMWRKSLCLFVGMQINKLLWKTVWMFFKKPKTKLPYYHEIPALDSFLKDLWHVCWRDVCTLTLLHLCSQQPVSAHQWMNGHTHTHKYYLPFKRQEIVSHMTTWMDLENMQSEMNQMQKDKHCLVSFLCGLISVWN